MFGHDAHQAYLEAPYDAQAQAKASYEVSQAEAEKDVRDDVLTAIVQALAVLDKPASDALLKAMRPACYFPNRAEKQRVERLKQATFDDLKQRLPDTLLEYFNDGIDAEVSERCEEF